MNTLWLRTLHLTASMLPLHAVLVYKQGVPESWNESMGIVSSGCNLIFLKVHKCASSTTAGIIRRIAAHYGLRGVHDTEWITNEPGIWANHGALNATQPPSMVLMARLRSPTLLVTFVRSPASRCLSAYYHFQISRRNASQTAESKINALKKCRDYVYNYLAPTRSETPRMLIRSVYSFVGVVELYDQSVVLMASMLGVSLGSVLYLPSKNSSAGHGAVDGSGTTFVPHTDLVDEPGIVQSFAAGDTFHAQNARDFALYDEAITHLHARIDADQIQFQQQADVFAAMKHQAFYTCKVQRPAKSHGATSTQNPDCYWNDNGCGYHCLDNISSLSVPS